MSGHRGRGGTVGRGTTTSTAGGGGNVGQNVTSAPLRGGPAPGSGIPTTPGRGAANNARRGSTSSTRGASGSSGGGRGGRGRGQGSHRGRPSPSRGRDGGGNPPGRDLLEGLVPTPLKTIKCGETPSTADIEMKDVQYLASYNWIETAQPTIIVPGSPRIWLARPVPFSVGADTGSTFVDQNGYRMAVTNRLVPLFRAVDFMEKERSGPKLDWSSVDIITDRRMLRTLLALVEGDKEGFRIDIQLAGQRTVLFHRWETRTKISSDGTGFGDSFERASTAPAPGCERGTLAGHFRIITYDFAGLRLVLRCEVDACYPADSGPEQSGNPGAHASDPLNDLVGAISSLNIASASSSAAKTPLVTKDNLRILRGGTVVPQSALIKIKTRSSISVGSFKWKRFYPQQFIGQIPTQVIGVHQKGHFHEVREQRLDAPELRDTARKAQEGLKKLRALLEEIHEYAMNHGKDARLSLVGKGGVLQIMQRKSADKYLPSDILDRFKAR